MLEDILNGLISLIVLIFNGLLSLLPDSPFLDFTYGITWGDFGDMIGMVFPVSAMITHFTAILSAFLAYYVVRWLLRAIKMIQ